MDDNADRLSSSSWLALIVRCSWTAFFLVLLRSMYRVYTFHLTYPASHSGSSKYYRNISICAARASCTNREGSPPCMYMYSQSDMPVISDLTVISFNGRLASRSNFQTCTSNSNSCKTCLSEQGGLHFVASSVLHHCFTSSLPASVQGTR